MNTKFRAQCCVLIFLVATQSVSAERPRRTAEELLAIYGPGFTLRVVDENGQPVEGAMAGIYAQRSEGKWYLGCNEDARRTDEQGALKLAHGQDQLDGGCVVAWHDERTLAGFRKATPDQLSEDGVFTIAVRPARRARGRITCSKLKPSGEAFGWTNVYVHAGDERPFGYASEIGEFEFLLPPGDYELEAYGKYVHHVRRPLHVELGGEELVVESIDLPPTQLALLRGKPAPELRGVVGWKNSEGLTLKDLKGRYVLLHFWGHWCGPCIGSMPELYAVHDRFPQEKLTIIGVHVGLGGDDEVDTVEELDAALATARKETWSDRDLPFPVALVSGKKLQHAGAETKGRGLAAVDYGITGYPSTVMIDPEGHVVGDVDEMVHSSDGLEELAKLIEAPANDEVGTSR